MIRRQNDWNDQLFELNERGMLSDGALLMGLKMGRVMWNSNPPAIYTGDGDAYKTVKVPRTSYYRHLKELLTTGAVAADKFYLKPQMVDIPEPKPVEDTSLSRW